MGGGGTYYDRDVTDQRQRTSAGFTKSAETALSRNDINPAVLPMNRRISSKCSCPIIFAFDVTGSMGTLPKIIYDKMPMIVGQLVENGYVKDARMSLSAIGDALCDAAPIQIGDFSEMKKLDDWLQRLWLEGGGGGQAVESYELTAYFYARCYDMKNAETPILIFTGDEGFREKLYGKELSKHFGGEHQDVGAQTIFDELLKKFKGNVFLIRRSYDGAGDETILAQWRKALGPERVIQMGGADAETDLAVADFTLGAIAIASGTRTLDEYIEDMKKRPLEMGGQKYKPQTQERLNSVRKALLPFATSRKAVSGTTKKSPQKQSRPVGGSKKGKRNDKKTGTDKKKDYQL